MSDGIQQALLGEFAETVVPRHPAPGDGRTLEAARPVENVPANKCEALRLLFKLAAWPLWKKLGRDDGGAAGLLVAWGFATRATRFTPTWLTWLGRLPANSHARDRPPPSLVASVAITPEGLDYAHMIAGSGVRVGERWGYTIELEGLSVEGLETLAVAVDYALGRAR